MVITLYLADFRLPSIPFDSPGYLTLSNACTPGCSTTEIWWDQIHGVPPAFNNVGTGLPGECAEPPCAVNPIPSESFTFTGVVGAGASSAPEPSSILLFGSGVLGLAGVLRRKLL